MPFSEQTHLVNYPENEITSDSNIIPYSQYLLETQNAAVQDTNSSAQQDAMILSVFEQLSNQVTNCNKVNKDNLIANESLSAELERYKEWEKESLTTTFNVLKNESKEKEVKNIDKEIALEKKVKELDNIVYKMGQSAQTVHMLMKPQVFYDNNLKQAFGFKNPFYLKKAQQIMPMLYDGSVIANETNMISNANSEETLMLEEESRSKIILKQKLSDEQAFWLQTSHPNTDKFASSPVKIEAPRELPKAEMQNSESCVKCVDLDAELLNKQNAYNDLSKKYFENNNLKAQLQAKDTTICKLKEHIKTMRENDKEKKVKHEMDETETINIELEHRKETIENAAQIPIATIVAPSMFKLDLDPLAPRLLQNREAHIYYLKHTQEQVDILRGIELLVYVQDTCPNVIKLSEKKVAITPMNKVKKVRFSEPLTSSRLKWKPTGRLFTIVGNSCPLTRITPKKIVHLKETTSNSVETPKLEIKVYSRRPKQIKLVGSSKKAKIEESKIANNSKPNHLWRSNATDIPSSSSLVNDRLSRLFSGNDQVAKIMGYGDYQLGNVIILRVYYVERLGHNLFSVGQFCNADLEVTFRKNTSFIQNLEGVDLLSGSRDTNLYIISLDDMLKTSPICLLSKASKTKSGLWHRWLSHLNFGTLNKLAKDVQDKTQLSRIKCMNSLRAIQSQLKFLIETLQDFGNMPTFKRTFSQDLDLLENHLTNEIISQTDCKTTLTKLRTTKYMLELILHQQRTPQLLKQKKLMQTQEDHLNPIPALNVDSLKADLVIIQNTCSEKEEILSKGDSKGTRIEHGVKREFMSLFGQDVDTFTSIMFLNIDQLQKQLDKDEFQEVESMTAFWVVNNQFQKFIDSKFTLDYDSQMTDTYFVEYTGIEVKHFRDTLLQHLGNVKKSIVERTRHQRQYEKRVNKRQMQTQESKIDTGKALDADLVDTDGIKTDSTVQDDNNRSGNDTDADDADIRPIYDKEPMAEVQLTAECNIFAIGQQHTEQPEIIVEGRVDQYPETCQVKSPMLDSSPDNQTTEYSKQSLKSENILLKKTVA
ncbi:hypothetical protein Tco_0692983 [Tanacetum coccineum]